MLKFLRNIAGSLLAAGLTAVALLNRNDISLTYSPFHPPVSLPFYALLLGIFAFGFIVGATVVWMNAQSDRKKKNKEAKTLRPEQAAQPAQSPLAMNTGRKLLTNFLRP